MDSHNIIIDVHEMTSKTVLRCGCGDLARDFDDTDQIGMNTGTCSRCGRPKKIRDIVPSGKIPLFPHLLVLHLKENNIPYARMSLSGTGGDFIVQSARLIVERKTMGDLIHTWIKGDPKGKLRLETQIQLCLDSYPDARVALLIEDYYNSILDFKNRCIWIPTYDNIKQSQRGNPYRQAGYYKVGLNPKSLLGKLDAMEARIARAVDNPRDAFNRLEIIRCSGAEHAVEWFMKEVAGATGTVQRRTIRVHRVKRAFTDLRDKQLFFLEGLPEIGPKTSTKLLEVYGTPKNALEHIDEWKGNRNLGRITKPMINEGKMVYGLPTEDEGDE